MAAVAGHASRHAVTSQVPTDRIFARYLEWIQECKEAIHTLRICIKQARAYREKCCSVLGAALGAALALEQAVYSGTLHMGDAQELQRLCAAVTAAIELAQQRVQVYGSQSGIRKYASLARRSAIEAKFSQIIERLEKLTKQAWILQNSSKPVGIQQDMRIHANSRLEPASSLRLTNTGLLTRSRLRRGCHCHTVQSVLYVGHTQGKNDSANTSGQIWWCLTSLSGSKLFAHDLATTTTSELQNFQNGTVPAVTSMQVDIQGYVWMGFKGGMLQVWDADRRACLCQGLDMAPADVRVITADSDSMWVGTDRGRISQLRLTAQKSDSGLNYYTDVVQTLQLAQVPGTSHVTAATPATLDPVAAQPQLTTPFAQKPRLTLSSSASSYHGPDATEELALGHECQLPRPAAASASARAALEGSNPEASSPLFTPFSRQLSRQPSRDFSGQPLSSLPLLGPGSNPLGRPPSHPPCRSMSAELIHAATLQTHKTTPGNQASFTSPAELRSLEQSQRQLPAAGQNPRQLPTVQSGLNDSPPVLTAAGGSRDWQVEAVAVVGGRLVISMQAKASASLQEWSLDGELLMSHACDDLGSVTCISPVPDIVKHQPLPSSSFPLPSQKPSEAATWQRLTRLSSTPPSQKQTDAASWQLLTGHVSGHLTLWQGSQQNLLQALAIIRAVGNSPVKSLVVLEQLQAVCSAHANGQIMLCVMPDQSAGLQVLPSQQAGEGQALHLLPLASTCIEAHRSGLQVCVEGDLGLVSVGALGSITVWPEAELRSVAHAAGLQLAGRYQGTVASAGATDTHQHMSQLERFFTPRSAKAVEKALGAMGQQLAREEEAQGHKLSPGLAALQGGGFISSHDAPAVLKDVVHLLNLSHGDSNDLPLAAHQPGVPAQSSLGYQGGTENLPTGYQGFAEACPGGLPLTQQGINSPRLVEHAALSPTEQALYQRRYSCSELPDLLRGPSTEPQHSQRESYEYSQSHRAGSAYSTGTTHDFASAQSHDLQSPLMRSSVEFGYRPSMDPESKSQQTGNAAQGSFADAQQQSGEFVHRSSADPQQAQQQAREMVRCMSKEQLACQQATYWSSWHPHAEDDKRLQRRVSFTDGVDFHNAAATAAAHAESSQPEASHPEPVRAGPPPPTTEYSSVAQGQQNEAIPSAAQLSAFYHSVNALLPRRGSTTSEQSMAYSSPPGSTHRGAGQLLRLESRASDPFSNPTPSRQDSLTMHESALAASGRALSHSHSRATRDSLPSHQSVNHSPSDSATRDAHVMQSRGGSGASGGSGSCSQSVKSSGGPPNLDRSSLSILQGIDQVTVAPQGMPRSQSHKNLCQGLDRISADSQPEPESSAPAVATAGQLMRRTKSKLGLDALASVESMNCPIIDYSQLEIKRKIGDGSIGQVYLGKWQETDVAVKVLTEMQNLSSYEGVHPQDPSHMGTWDGDGPPPRQGGEKATKAGGLKFTGLDSHGWGSDDDTVASSIGTDSEVVPSEERQEALRNLEREVSIMAALRHPNVVMFMGLCLEPPCIVTEFCARGSLYDVLKKARGTPAFAQQLDWSRRISMALDAAKGVLQLHSHKPPILHRDLKSPNMLVDRHWRVKVTDFNLSRMVKSGSSNASVTSMLANNPRWLAPEVVSRHDYSKAADVYSFGIILWEMMTWRLPWDELNPFQIMLVLTQQRDRPEIPALNTLPGQPLPGIEDYVGLMQDCWTEDPSKRPRFEDIIISLRGLLESANNRHKLQKTLTAVPRLSTSCAVPPNMNKLAVVGQTPFGAPGADPQQTPTPLEGQAKPGPLQVYETDRPFFGSTPVGGLDIMTSSRHGTGQEGGGSALQTHPISGGQSQQQIFQSALRHKGRSPTRRHTFGGTATNFGDQFDTAPSIFYIKGSIEGAGLDPIRRKSLSAAPQSGQSAVPAWLRAKRAAAAGEASVSENPQTAATGSAGKAQQGIAGTAQASSQPASALEASHGSQAVTQQAAAADAAEEGRSSGPVPEASIAGGREQGRPVRRSMSQVLGSLTQAKGSITHAIGSIGQVIGGTPFAAFAQQSLRGQSHISSDDSESDQLPFKHLIAEPLSLEETMGGGSLTKRNSGPFGGRGVALGHMMAAQQQWRQDSFSKAQQERRSSEESIRNGGENETTRLTSRDRGDHKHHGRAESGNNAEGRRATGGSIGDASGDDHFIGWRPRQAQRCDMLGKAGPAWIESLDEICASSAGAAEVAQPGIRSTEAVAELPVTAFTVATAAPAPVNAYVNPFLTASQNWHPCDSDGSSAEESGLSTSSLQEPSTQISAAAYPFAAAAQLWLAARQNSFTESDDSISGQEKPPASQSAAATAVRQSSRNMADHSGHDRQSPVGSPRAQHRRERLGGKHMAASQASQEMKSPLEASQFQHRSRDARAGPPPAKSTFRNSHAKSSFGASSTSPNISSGGSVDRYECFDSDKQSATSSYRPPPTRKGSFAAHAGRSRLDTIHSDSSAEASAQYSTKSSNTSASSAQLSNATAIVDLALTDSVSASGSGPAGRLPSVLLSKELDDLPFSTRLQTVIEGLEQSNSPCGSVKASADPSTQSVHAEMH